MAKDDKPKYDPDNPLAWRTESGAEGGTFADDRALTEATGEPTDAEVAEADFLERMPALQHPAQLPRDRADAVRTRTQRDRDDLAGDTAKALKAERKQEADDKKDDDRRVVAAATGTENVVEANKAAAKKSAKAKKDDK